MSKFSKTFVKSDLILSGSGGKVNYPLKSTSLLGSFKNTVTASEYVSKTCSMSSFKRSGAPNSIFQQLEFLSTFKLSPLQRQNYLTPSLFPPFQNQLSAYSYLLL